MREVLIHVHCDACAIEFVEDYEGQNTVTFNVLETVKEMDLCDDCLFGSFLQEARPVVPPNDFHCEECEKSYGTQRGLSHHITRTHKEKS